MFAVSHRRHALASSRSELGAIRLADGNGRRARRSGARSGRAISIGILQAVTDLVHGLPEKQVAHHPVSVRADDQQVDRLAFQDIATISPARSGP